MLQAGTDFAGFTIERQLGVGGMGVVYLARHPRLNCLVALKVLNATLAADPGARAAFDREAALAAELDHPNIVSVFDRSNPDDTALWLSMSYVNGGDASGLLTGSPTGLAADRAVRLLTDAAGALDFAHQRGVLHRDIKPANLLIAHDPHKGERALLSDFGIARSVDGTATASALVATLAYAAPERFGSSPTDHRADIYSLGCTFYQLLTGRVPFPRADQMAILAAHLNEPPPAVTAVRPDLPPALDPVIATALAKDPGQRYASCADFAAAAQQALRAGHRPGVPAANVAAPPTVRVPQPGPVDSPTTARRRSGKRRIVVALVASGVVIVAAVTGTIVYLTGSGTSKPKTAALRPPVAVAVPVGSLPQDVAIDPATHTAYVSVLGDNSLTLIDTATHAVSGKIQVTHPGALAIDSGAHTAYVIAGYKNTLSVIDTNSRTAVAQIPAGNSPETLAVDPTTHTVYVTDHDNTITVIDGKAGTVVGTVPTTDHPSSLAVDPSTHSLFVTQNDNTLAVINTVTRAITATVPLDDLAESVAVDPTTHTAYVTVGSSVDKVDTLTHTVTSKIQWTWDGGIAVDPGEHTLYVTNKDPFDPGMDVIDTVSGSITDRPTVGKAPQKVAVDPTDHTVYVTNFDDSSVTVITR